MSKQEILFEPDQVYHVYNHANGNENLFEHKDHYLLFLNTFFEKCSDTFKTYAFVLMPNHFHLVVKVRGANIPLINENIHDKNGIHNQSAYFEYEFSRSISQKFSNFLNSYVQKYNNRVNRKGSLFRQNTRRKLLDTDSYFKTAIKYVHFNPVKDGFCQDPKDWAYSSYRYFLNGDDFIIPINEVIKIYGGQKKFLNDHQEKDIKKIEFSW
jgi:REP element-mobilizing transposase RayT